MNDADYLREEEEAEERYYRDTMEYFYGENWNSNYSEDSGCWYDVD